MDRRHFLGLLSTPAVVALLQACGSASPSSGSTPATVGKGQLLKSTAARRSTVAPDAAAAVRASNSFGADMLARLTSAQPNSNLVFSPLSIALALTMTSGGARGTTLTQMNDVLHIADPTTIHHSMNALSTALAARTASRPNAATGKPDSVEVDLANSTWGQRGLAFVPAFLDLLAAEYGAGLNITDFAADPELARATINKWVADATHDRIRELLVKGVVSARTALVLVNAIYMKAAWALPFQPTATKDAPFTNSAGAVVQAHMMHLHDDHMKYASGAGWQAVDIDYVFHELAMTIVLPDDIGAPLQLDAVTAALESRPVDLSMPRFDIESAVDLATTLSDMGMSAAFTNADFSGITTQEPLAISAVVHQANITVDERGTEAAAATAVVMDTSASSTPPVGVVLDRPFWFAVRDIPTGAVLFLGRISDPSITR